MRILILAVFLVGAATRAEELNYTVADPDLKVVLLDKSEKESFLAVQVDTRGRLFVGGREALFVYEPKPEGGYASKQELYRFPDHTWVYDIAVRGHDLYVLTVSALYVFPDGVVKREGLVPKRLIWGVPLGHVHQCFHGLAWGPEGDLYMSMGDPLWYYGDFSRPDHWGHWTFFSQPEGTRTPYTGVGGVFRCRPDGSNFQIVARGLRNSCGLCFDHAWNLFTNDNDHEGMPAHYVPGRLIHVVPHGYYSWPRGWLVSKTPERADLLETMNDHLGRYVPVGQAYYDDTFLPEKYRHNLLVARWCTRKVARYPIEPRGASFKAEEYPLLDGKNDARPVGVCVGRGGRIFVTISYMAQNEGSPVYRSDLAMITRADDPPSMPFEAYDAVKATPEKLLAEHASSSWSRKLAATVEMHRRRMRVIPSDTPPRSDEQAFSQLDPVAQRTQLQAMFEAPDPPMNEVIDGPARSKDTYLRQAATLLLAERAPLEKLAELCQSSDTPTRLAGVLAVGFKLTIPPATAEIPKNLKLDKLKDESAYVIQYADKKIDLREFGRIGNFTVADHWKQATHTAEQEQLFALLQSALADHDEQVRLQAVHFLSLLNDPRSEPQVAAVVAANEERRLAIEKVINGLRVWLVGPFADGAEGFDKVHPPEDGAIELSKSYPGITSPVAWQEVKTTRTFEFGKIVGPYEHASVYALFRLESGARQRAHLLVGSDDGIKVWHNGRVVWTNDVSRAALPYQDQVSVQLEPGSNDFLIRVRNLTGDSQLYISYRTLSPVEYALPEKIDIAGLAERLAAGTKAGGATVPLEFLKVDWAAAIAEGDIAQGKKLYEAIGCAKCHALSSDATVTGGPSLADAARRFTIPHLVESVLLPSKQISPVFKATQVLTTDGRTFMGLLVGETAEKIELLLPDAKRATIAKPDIEQRVLVDQSPMPQGVIKQPHELRDILAYLLSVKSAAP